MASDDVNEDPEARLGAARLMLHRFGYDFGAVLFQYLIDVHEEKALMTAFTEY